MSKERRKYNKEFKMGAIRLFENEERPVSEIERELGITPGLLSKWIRELSLAPNKDEAFPGNGRLTGTEARIRQLERENMLLKQDKEILKKALKMFSKDARRNTGLLRNIRSNIR
jgi:transposase